MPASLLPSPAKYFRSYRDWWVYFGAAILIIFYLICLVGILWSTALLWQRAIFAGVLLILLVSLVDKVYFTIYELNDTGLAIHSQLRKAFIPYREMREIVPSGVRALVSTRRRKRFALSKRNITIKIKDKLWDEISVSPDPQDLFLDQLLGKIDGERSRRATVSRKK
jgi:hypothetical protein